MNFKEFLKENREKVNKLAEMNTLRNGKGLAVLSKNDVCRDATEDEWDKIYACKEKE